MIHWKRRKKIQDSLKGKNNPGENIAISDKTIANLEKFIKKHFLEAPKNKAPIPVSAMVSRGKKRKAYFSSSRKVDELDEYINREYVYEERKQMFTEFLRKKLADHGMTFQQLFESIKLDPSIRRSIINSSEVTPYQPDKNTVLKIGIAMQMYIDEMNKLLKTAGFDFSKYDKKDIIIMYFIGIKNYDLYEINKRVLERTGKSLYGE
jgi:hypothetical protein